ncbi:MAG: hypothetical protein ACYC6G_08900 [Desulfobaccales bacterium]
MTCEDLKAAIMHLDEAEQRQLMLAVLPEIWPNLAGDDACVKLIRQLVDEASVKEYQQEHLDHI